MANNSLSEALTGFNGVTNIKLESVKQEELSKQFSESKSAINSAK